MKTLIALVAVSFLSMGSISGDKEKVAGTEMYCVTIKDGKAVVEYNGEVVKKEVTLSDGTIVKEDGTVVTRDGKEVTLKHGECVDKDGVLTLWRHREEPI
jgi:hypothetical protein